MLVNMKEMLDDARKNKYGVGLFNTANLEMVKGIIEAAEEMRSPVIVGNAEVLLPSASIAEMRDMIVPMAKRASVPVALHFDHGIQEEKIIEALRLGFTSVMYDCSQDSFADNVEKVKRMTDIAHAFGATIEAELGHVGANEKSTEGEANDHSIYTEPDQAARYVEETGVDALAVAIGTAHGAYKETPKLDIGRLKEISDQVKVPLVLHGGSGLSDDDFRNCIAGGISKVNIFTDNSVAAARAAIEYYQEGMGIWDLSMIMTKAVKEETRKKMILFNSVNKA